MSGVLAGIAAVAVTNPSGVMEEANKVLADPVSCNIFFWLLLSLFSICYLPFSCQSFPSMNDLLRMDHWTDTAWLQVQFSPSPSANVIAMELPGPLGYFFAKFFRFFALPLLLSKHTAIPILFVMVTILQSVLAMTSQFWFYPNVGFLGAIFSVYKLFRYAV